jgi:hypothetical protein
MSAKLRALSTTTFLIAGLTMLTVAAEAADLVAEPQAGVSARATSAVHRRGHDWRWHRCCWAHGQFVAGVRGASPLTVPFFGHGWYPGPVYYHGPPPGSYCCEGEDAAISVRY